MLTFNKLHILKKLVNYVYTFEAITAVKIMKRFITPKSSLLLFDNLLFPLFHFYPQATPDLLHATVE